MKVDIKVPAVGESITEATIASWSKKNGDAVKKNDVLLSLETDKATVEVVSENDGQLSIGVQVGAVVKIGATVAAGAAPSPSVTEKKEAAPAAPSAPVTSAPKANVNDTLSPAVRRVVEERGLDPAVIQGSGKDGRITKFDAESFSGKSAAPTPLFPTVWS